MTIHAAAALGFASGADRYAAGRPDYPPDVSDWLTRDLALRPGTAALDLGAGTGKFLPYLRVTGARLAAVEPVEAMRARIIAKQPDVEALAGTADAIPLLDGGMDAVVCAQAFHWFATNSALSEIARVLRPGGRLGLIWNVRDTSVPWVRRLTGIVDEYQGDAPRQASGAWKRVFPAPEFGTLTERRWRQVHHGAPRQVILDRAMSISFIAALPEATREVVDERLRRLITDTPELADADEIDFPYVTHAWWCARKPSLK